jgi:hypothetical protein
MDKRPAGHQNRERHEIWPVPRWPVVCSATPGETLMRGSLSFPSSPLKNLALLWAFVTGRRFAAVCWGCIILYAGQEVDMDRRRCMISDPCSRPLTSSSIDYRAVQKLWSRK